MLPNNGTVSEHGAMRNVCVTTLCCHSSEFPYLDTLCCDFTERVGRSRLATDHCSRITSHLSTRNLTFQNGVTYTWDSENRLLSITDGTTTNTFTYDGNHRRVTKRTTVSGLVTQKTHFVYDGWNVIEERTNYDTATTFTLSTFALTRTLTWGTDLSGSLQGAGGVGGLIMSEEISGTTTTAYHYHYDGNGNVTEVTDSSGNSAATYRYDAFGNTLVSTGTYATTNKYRFSTKPIDSEIATAPLYYYGYRYYDPITGRWPSRDPIEERGGVNLYGFVENDGINSFDLLGNNPFSGGSTNWILKGTNTCCRKTLGRSGVGIVLLWNFNIWRNYDKYNKCIDEAFEKYSDCYCNCINSGSQAEYCESECNSDYNNAILRCAANVSVGDID